MSDVKRYVAAGDGIVRTDKDGPLVMHSDYARLKADVGELADALKLASEVGIKIADEVTRLKAEVERLRKAGDALHKSMLECGPNEMAEEFDHDRWWASYYAWNAAKEGKGQP